jgi:hypothetical protein
MELCKSPKIIKTFREREREREGAQEKKSMKRNKGIKI